MQIEHIRIGDIIKNEGMQHKEGVAVEKSKEAQKSAESQELRSISVDSPFYNKSNLKEKSFAEKMADDLEDPSGALALHNEMAVYSQTVSNEDFQKMSEDGFDPMNMEAHTIVTVTDRIKVAMAKAGVDVSAMGGIDDKIVEALSGNELQANQIEQAFNQADLPLDGDMLQDVQTALVEMDELPEQLPEESISYLLKNEMEPTIDNIHQASYGAGASEYRNQDSAENFAVQQDSLPEDLKVQLAQVIEDAGLEPTDEMMQKCQWMMEENISVTSDNIKYLEDLQTVELSLSTEEVAEKITNAVAQGNNPKDALLLSEHDVMAQAKELAMAARQLEETKFLMTTEATYQLLKQDISIDFSEMEQVVEALKEQENAMLEALLTGETKEVTEENIREYQAFTEAFEIFAKAPVEILGKVEKPQDLTIAELNETAEPVKQQYAQAQERYETMMTAPRSDLGDSIKKAFANVDDILQDLDLEINSANERAVRILAYNETPLTKENILEMKSVDMQVQKLFHNMKPNTVMEMIRQGENPLDKSIQELNEFAENFEQEDGDQEADQYAEFLWKMERMGDISPEERESFVGMYRLIHQVEKGDGAAIGALISQGADVTLRNLMTAVRSGKHTGREFAIDDSFGGLEEFHKDALSITEQIEMAYQNDCLHQAGEELTPVKMQQFDSAEEYMNMSPEQFRDALVDMNEQEEVKELEQELERAYIKENREEFRQALQSETQVYEILEKYDMPTTPAFLQGIREMLKDHNEMYRKLNQFAMDQKEGSQTISDLIEDLIEDFGEAVKRPEEMAEAQHKLEETAERVMKNMLVEEDVSSIDVRGMKLITTQIRAIGQMAEQKETYELPILVEDQVGTLSLKIVRGQDKKGLVDVAMDTEKTGTVRCSFRYEEGNITGDLQFEKQEMRDIFADHMHLLAESMGEETGLPVSFSFGWNESVSRDDFYVGEVSQTEEKDEITTKALYGVAKSFIDTLTDIIS